MNTWGTAHVAFVLGMGGLACGAIGPACVQVVEGALGLGTAVSADGDPTNEVRVATELADDGFNGLIQAGKYGIDRYRSLSDQVRGLGYNVHHIIEKRFYAVLGYPKSATGRWPSVVLTPEEHQMITRLWEQEISYGDGTANATSETLWRAVQTVYAGYPALLEAAKHTILGQ